MAIGRWRARASEMRALAESMPDAEAKKSMLRIAENYDRLAARALPRITQAPPESKPVRRGEEPSGSTAGSS